MPHPDAVRHLAARLREQAEEIRDEARAVRRAAAQAPWQGQAAEAMRTATDRHAGQLVACAERHDEAAAALVHHAERVEATMALIAAIERRVHSLMASARARLADLTRAALGVVDPLDDLLDRFDPPDPGSLAWLSVDLPGLHLGGLGIGR